MVEGRTRISEKNESQIERKRNIQKKEWGIGDKICLFCVFLPTMFNFFLSSNLVFIEKKYSSGKKIGRTENKHAQIAGDIYMYIYI